MPTPLPSLPRPTLLLRRRPHFPRTTIVPSAAGGDTGNNGSNLRHRCDLCVTRDRTSFSSPSLLSSRATNVDARAWLSPAFFSSSVSSPPLPFISSRRRWLSSGSDACHEASSSATRKLQGPTDEDLSHFKTILSSSTSSLSSSVVTDPEELIKYNVDWTGRYHGRAKVVLRPHTTEQVSKILKYCYRRRIGVVPQGGNTGLVGGSVPLLGNDANGKGDNSNANDDNEEATEVVLSLEALSSPPTLETDSGILVAPSGCILDSLQSYAAARGFLIPIDIGSKGSCQIGGNVATNAGGQYYYRFGSLFANVVGLEVVLPDAEGTVLSLGMGGSRNESSCSFFPNRKDNTGYHLRNLFIGSEGTLGIITKVAIACPPLPSSTTAAFLACDDYQAVRSALHFAKEELGEILSAVEVMDRNTLMLVKNTYASTSSSTLRMPLDVEEHPLYLLVETKGSNAEHDAEKMDSFLQRCFDSSSSDDSANNDKESELSASNTSSMSDGVVAQDETQLANFWKVRESCNPACAATGAVYKYDVSVPIAEYVAVGEEVEHELKKNDDHQELLICVWGHVADGNAHINIVTPGAFTHDSDLEERINKVVYNAVLKRGGSISAEHGLGQQKNEKLRDIKDPAELAIMRATKDIFDPKGILNPGKFLPANN